jgi:hypothetical protein
MKLKIKKSYNVFGTKFKVKFVNTNMYAGLCDPDIKTIFISVNQSEEQIIATFFHEMFHAMQFVLGMHNAISREMMEMLAENSASLIMGIFKSK